MTDTPVSKMDFKLRLDLAGLCNNAADTLDRYGENGVAFDLREVARFVAELKAGTGTLAEFCDVLCLPMPPAGPVWNHNMAAAPRDGTRVLLCRTSGVAIGYWSKTLGNWYIPEIEICIDPSAWMPLPPLPEVTRCRS